MLITKKTMTKMMMTKIRNIMTRKMTPTCPILCEPYNCSVLMLITKKMLTKISKIMVKKMIPTCPILCEACLCCFHETELYKPVRLDSMTATMMIEVDIT